MSTSAHDCLRIFQRSIGDYHRTDDVNAPMHNPYDEPFHALLYQKNWIDTVQWHLEDLIRATDIQSGDLVALKRRIDASNQDRTDVVEQLDDLFIARFRAITPSPSARLNSETPAWLLDRISILQLKIYHFEEQVQRADASEQHKNACQAKLDILYIQNKDMLRCFDELMQDLQDGTKLMKVYRQMKMYNDAALNPVLYKK